MTDRLAALLADAADAGPVVRPGPQLRDRARRRWRRRQAGATLACVLAVVSLAVVGGRLGHRGPQPPDTYARTGPGTASALAAGHWEQLPAAPIAGRAHPIAVWTGSRLLVWGGADERTGAGLADGASYEPATRRWERLPSSPLRSRATPKGVWTGTELIVWGGPQDSGRTVALPTMAAYNPATGSWRVLPHPPQVPPDPAVVWDGRRLLVVGLESPSLAPGPVPPVRARAMSLDPLGGRWTELRDPPLGHLGGIQAIRATATDRGLYVLSSWTVQQQTAPGTYTGQAGQQALLLENGQWSDAPAPAAATSPLWTGRELLSPARPPPTAGTGGGLGARYRGQRLQLGGAWQSIAAGPVDDLQGSSAWTGAALVTAGTTTATSGPDGQHLPGEAAAWDPATDAWSLLPAAPLVGERAVQVWAGDRLLQWGLLHRPTPPGFKGLIPQQQGLLALVPGASQQPPPAGTGVRAPLPAVVVAADGSRVAEYDRRTGRRTRWVPPEAPGKAAGQLVLAGKVVLYDLSAGGSRRVQLTPYPARADAGPALIGEPGTFMPAALPDVSRYAYLATGDDAAYTPRSPQDVRLVVTDADPGYGTQGVGLDPRWLVGGIAFAGHDRVVVSTDGALRVFTFSAPLGRQDPGVRVLPAAHGCRWTLPTAMPAPDRLLVLEKCDRDNGGPSDAVVVDLLTGRRLGTFATVLPPGPGDVDTLDLDVSGQHLIAQVHDSSQETASRTRELPDGRSVTTVVGLVSPAWR